MEQEHRTALVTGAASGIGLAGAQLLAARGVRVVLLDRSKEVHAIAHGIGPGARGMVADLADAAQIEAVCGEIIAAGGCDILVNSAGVHPKRNGVIVPLEDMGLDEWEQVMRINLTAPMLLCKALVGAMKAKGWGRIINIASRAGRTYSDRAGTHYSVSKAGLIGLTRKLGGDFARFGITVNCICPGQIDTPMARTSDPSVLAYSARASAMGRIGSVDEVASMIAHLASDEAGFMTGAMLDINGGAYIGG